MINYKKITSIILKNNPNILNFNSIIKFFDSYRDGLNLSYIIKLLKKYLFQSQKEISNYIIIYF